MMRVIVSNTTLSENLQERKDLFMELKKHFPDSCVCFAASDLNDHLLEREQDWAREWVGIGVPIKGFYICCEWDARKKEDIPCDVELGIRKTPETVITEEKINEVSDLNIDGYEKITNNDWWYYWKDASDIMQIDRIVEEMNYLIKKLNDV